MRRLDPPNTDPPNTEKEATICIIESHYTVLHPKSQSQNLTFGVFSYD